ncbi:MAG: hypoxanthine phosphoribosyltransferase [Fimbriimonadales bacterium]|nr:hypoxanthine phosphoribosyltransferase [Fimbriimonadales bacterium]
MTHTCDSAWLERFPELEMLIPSTALQARVQQLGEQITRDYCMHPPLLVGVLKGSLVFLADLMRAIPLPVAYDFVAVSSYGDETYSTGQVRLIKDLDSPIRDRHVLLVEDIYDTGLTLEYLLGQLRQRQPASLRVCALLSKPARHQVPIELAYCGFEIPDRFVVGYGLDYAERYRNLPFIAVLNTV